jgi:single-stranded-DNA-specific exonuclease
LRRALLRTQGAFNGRDEPNLAGLVDLVALGTVADVVRLTMNRIFVEQGLARIRAGRAQPGVLALFAVAGRDAQRATAFDLALSRPAPERRGKARRHVSGIRCLLAATQDEAMPLAVELDRLNRQRRDVEASMQEEALADLAEVSDAVSDQYSVCLYREEWHQGVVGIVASRLKDRFHRPAIVFARGTQGELKGSGRSIAGFHLRDAIDLVAKRDPALISRFGGHAFAAGLTIAEDGLPAFAAAFEQVAREQLTRRNCTAPTNRRRAGARRSHARPGGSCGTAYVGQGMPAPLSTTRSTSWTPGSSAENIRALGLREATSDSTPSCSTTPSLYRLESARPTVWKSTNGRAGSRCSSTSSTGCPPDRPPGPNSPAQIAGPGLPSQPQTGRRCGHPICVQLIGLLNNIHVSEH